MRERQFLRGCANMREGAIEPLAFVCSSLPCFAGLWPMHVLLNRIVSTLLAADGGPPPFSLPLPSPLLAARSPLGVCVVMRGEAEDSWNCCVLGNSRFAHCSVLVCLSWLCGMSAGDSVGGGLSAARGFATRLSLWRSLGDLRAVCRLLLGLAGMGSC